MAFKTYEQQQLGPELAPKRDEAAEGIVAKLRALGARVPETPRFADHTPVQQRTALAALFYRIFPGLDRD